MKEVSFNQIIAGLELAITEKREQIRGIEQSNRVESTKKTQGYLKRKELDKLLMLRDILGVLEYKTEAGNMSDLDLREETLVTLADVCDLKGLDKYCRDNNTEPEDLRVYSNEGIFYSEI